MNLDAENRLEEGLGDILLAEHHREHELVGDSQLFKGSMFCFHFWLMRERPRAGE